MRLDFYYTQAVQFHVSSYKRIAFTEQIAVLDAGNDQVIGYDFVVPRDKLKSTLTLSYTAFTRYKNTYTVYRHEHPVYAFLNFPLVIYIWHLFQ